MCLGISDLRECPQKAEIAENCEKCLMLIRQDVVLTAEMRRGTI